MTVIFFIQMGEIFILFDDLVIRNTNFIFLNKRRGKGAIFFPITMTKKFKFLSKEICLFILF